MTTQPRDPTLGKRVVDDLYLHLGALPALAPAQAERGQCIEQGLQRQLIALVRTGLPAPVQLMIRHALLAPDTGFFDHGCGRGGDITAFKDRQDRTDRRAVRAP